MSETDNDFAISDDPGPKTQNNPKIRSKTGLIFALMIIGLLPVALISVWSIGITGSATPAILSLAYILIGMVAIYKNAKVMRLVTQSDADQAGPELLERSKWMKIFWCAFAITCAVGLYAAIIIPGISTYRMQAYDNECQKELHKIVLLQDAYFAKHDRYTQNLDKLTGYTASPEYKVTLVSADEKCWQATASHAKGQKIRTFRYDSCNGGLVNKEPELSPKD